MPNTQKYIGLTKSLTLLTMQKSLATVLYYKQTDKSPQQKETIAYIYTYQKTIQQKNIPEYTFREINR